MLARRVDEARLTAPAAAARWLRRALDELPPADARRSGLLRRLATAELFSGRLREAESIARGVLADDDAVDPDGDVAFVLGQSLFLQGRLDEADELFEKVEGMPLGSRQPMVLVDAASTAMFAGDLDAARASGERALMASRATRDIEGETAALAVLSSVLGLAGELRRAVDCGRAAAARADTSGLDAALRNAPHLFLANALLWADQLDECRDALDRAAEVGRRLALGWDEPARLATLADLLFRTGEWDGAVRAAELGLRRSLDRGAGLGDVWMRCVLGRIHLHRGELELAAEETAGAERLVDGGATGIERVVFLRALVTEASGEVDTANAMSRGLWAELECRGINLKLLEIASDAARIARRCDDRSFGLTVVETIRRLAHRCPDTVAPAVLARCRGLVERDPDLLARAATMLRQRRRPVEQACAKWEAASLLDQRGACDRAAALHASAAATLAPIGAQPLPIDLLAAKTVTEPDTPWSALTPAERTVVDLVADGLSNADIATRLVCSRRTVESHLHHVYTKLGTSSRVALAVEARRQRRAA